MSCGCRVFLGLIFVVVFGLFFNQPCVHKIAVSLILVQNCLRFIVLSVSFTVMLQSVYLFKEKVLIVLGLFVQPGIVLHTHCTVQDSQDSVFQSLCHLMMLLTQGFSHGCICLYLTVSANAWLFQPVHCLRRLRPWGVAETGSYVVQTIEGRAQSGA